MIRKMEKPTGSLAGCAFPVSSLPPHECSMRGFCVENERQHGRGKWPCAIIGKKPAPGPGGLQSKRKGRENECIRDEWSCICIWTGR